MTGTTPVTGLSPQDVAEQAVALSRASNSIILVEESNRSNLRWANNTLATNGLARNRRLTAIATLERSNGTGVGVATGDGWDSNEVERLVRTAESNAYASAAAEDAHALVRPTEYSSAEWHEPATEVPPGVFAELTSALREAFERGRCEHRRFFGYAEQTVACTYLASTTGLRLRHQESSGHLQLHGTSADGAASAWTGVPSPTFTAGELYSLERRLVQQLQWSRREGRLPAGRYDVLLSPSSVADLMLFFYDAADARGAADGVGAFAKAGGGTRVGEQLTSTPLDMWSDPFAPGLECTPFVSTPSSDEGRSVFDNGLPLRPTSWIKAGALQALVQTRHTAALTGLPVTPRIANLTVESHETRGSLDDMVRQIGRGLLVMNLWYIRSVDPRTLLLTGLTRDGVFLVEGGEVASSVNDFRFNESPLDLMKRIRGVGTTERTLAREWGGYFPRAAMPSLRVDGFNMSSVSERS